MKLPKEVFDEIYSKVPRLCVEVLILTNDKEGDGESIAESSKGRIVLSKRLIEPFKGMWHIPGGTVQYGEKLCDVVHRIAEEELGVKLGAMLDRIGIIEYINSDGVDCNDNNAMHAISFVYLCKLMEGNEYRFRGSFQAEEIKTFYIDELPDGMVPAHEEFLVELMKKSENVKRTDKE